MIVSKGGGDKSVFVSTGKFFVCYFIYYDIMSVSLAVVHFIFMGFFFTLNLIQLFRLIYLASSIYSTE